LYYHVQDIIKPKEKVKWIILKMNHQQINRKIANTKMARTKLKITRLVLALQQSKKKIFMELAKNNRSANKGYRK
jgi:hypothetical protein